MSKVADRDKLIGLVVKLTTWNLGTLVVLSLAAAGGFATMTHKISELDHKVDHTRYLLAVALGLVEPEGHSNEGRPNPISTVQVSAAIDAAAIAEADSIAGRPGTNPAGGGGCFTQSEGQPDVRSF